MAAGKKVCFEIRMDRNFMTSHSIFAGLPHRFHAPFTQVATARPEPLKQHAERERESDNDFPSTYFFAAAEVNFVALRRRGGKFYLWNNFTDLRAAK